MSTPRDASASQISNYNKDAGLAAANIDFDRPLVGPGGAEVTWSALVSTNAVDADVNTGTNSRDDENDVPIYTLDGQLVATGNAELWDGAIGARITMTELETTYNGEVWTGTGIDGKEYIGSQGLGSGQPAFGISNWEEGEESSWIYTATTASGNLKSIYVISSVVPEPSTFVLWGILAGLGLVAVRRYRK
jgi:hypothetical protein